MKLGGLHLMLDGYATRLDEGTLLSAVHGLVVLLGMEMMGEPLVKIVPERPELVGTDEDEGGVSVIAPITTSHIAIHAWPVRGAVQADVFSCKDFDSFAAEVHLNNCLGILPLRSRVRVIERGL